MVKTFCDRCGAEIEEHSYAWLSRKVLYTNARLIPHTSRKDWESDDKYICPKCEDSYIHWFLHPEEGDKNATN